LLAFFIIKKKTCQTEYECTSHMSQFLHFFGIFSSHVASFGFVSFVYLSFIIHLWNR